MLYFKNKKCSTLSIAFDLLEPSHSGETAQNIKKILLLHSLKGAVSQDFLAFFYFMN